MWVPKLTMGPHSSWWQSWLSFHCLPPGVAQGSGWFGHSSVTKQVAHGPGAGWGCHPQRQCHVTQPLLDPQGGCVSPRGSAFSIQLIPMWKGLHLYLTAAWAATAAGEGHWPWLLSHSETPFPGAPVMVSPWPEQIPACKILYPRRKADTVQRVCRGWTQWCFGAYIVICKEQNVAGTGC